MEGKTVTKSIEYTKGLPENDVGWVELTFTDKASKVKIAKARILYDKKIPYGFNYDFIIQSDSKEITEWIRNKFNSPFLLKQKETIEPRTHLQITYLPRIFLERYFTKVEVCSEFRSYLAPF